MKIGIAIIMAISSIFAWSASATHLVVDQDTGKLFGANSLDINGTLYDVRFVDGTCASLFNGCNEQSDFILTNFTDFVRAAEVLLAQVFINTDGGQFDDFPALTRGCSSVSICRAELPFQLSSPGIVDVIAARNGGLTGVEDRLIGTVRSSSYDSGFEPQATWAVFSRSNVPDPDTAAVPEPDIWAMFLLGFLLTGLALRRSNIPKAII
jgi:hypothetical protein